MKKTTGIKKWIRLSVILYIVILSVAAVFTMAWFLFDETATIKTADNMQITAGSKLEIAEIDANGNLVNDWGQLITLKTSIDTFPDVSGDGNHFYYPKALTDDDRTFDTYDSFIDLNDPKNPVDSSTFYITVHLRFRTTMPMEIYLSEDSFVHGKTDILTGADVENKSLFGDFSRDGIAGAVRVAFIEYDAQALEEYKLKNVWIPNDKYEVTYSEDELIGDSGDHKAYFNTDGKQEYTILEDGTRSYDYGYMTRTTENGVDKMTFVPWSEEQYLNKAVSLESQGLAYKDANGVHWISGSASLIKFDESDIKDGFAERDLFIKIWIEGTDREADKAFTDGQLKYKFSFIGIQKNEFEVANPDVYAKNIVSDGNKLYYKDGSGAVTEINDTGLLQYSYDGVFWKPYSGLMTPDEGANNLYAYVRYAEKGNVKASKARYVEFGALS